MMVVVKQLVSKVVPLISAENKMVAGVLGTMVP
jgi:hypothetical protein